MKAIYIRTSGTDQHPQLQLNDIYSMCPENEAQLFCEQQSAWKENSKRPVFAELQKLIAKKKITDLYVWDLDRIQRNRVRLKDFFIHCKSNNCTIHSYRQSWLNHFNTIQPPFNDLFFELLTGILGWIGEEESTKRSQRVLLSINKTDNGTFSKYGNKWGRKGLSTQVKNKVLKLKKDGLSVREIAERVIYYDSTRNERKLSKSAVHKILVEKMAVTK